jgi:hypothetical protein
MVAFEAAHGSHSRLSNDAPAEPSELNHRGWPSQLLQYFEFLRTHSIRGYVEVVIKRPVTTVASP